MQKRAVRFVTRNYSRETSIAHLYSPEIDLKKFMLEYIKRRLQCINQESPSNLPDHVRFAYDY